MKIKKSFHIWLTEKFAKQGFFGLLDKKWTELSLAEQKNLENEWRKNNA